MNFRSAQLLLCHFALINLMGCADRLLLHPPRSAHSPRNASQRAIPFGNGILQIWTSRTPRDRGAADKPKAFVLEFVGNASRAEYAIEASALRWRPTSAEIWAVNYPGYGASTGPAILRAIGPAALAAYDALAAVAAGRPIFVVGRSLGTAAALHVAANRPVAGLVLHSPTPLREVILQDFGWWNLWLVAGPVALQIPDDLDALANARRCGSPAIFLITRLDTLVRPERQQLVVSAYAGQAQVIPLDFAGHNDSPTSEDERAIQSAIAQLAARVAPP